MLFASEGDIIDEYKMVSEINSKAESGVWIAEHVKTKNLVAVKIIPKASFEQAKQLMQYARGISIMKQIEHPLIVKYISNTEDQQYFYVFMEYCEKGDLSQYIERNGQISENTARKMFCEIIVAVSYLHCVKHIAHRDLNPRNILISNNDSIKLADFGLSKQFTDSNQLLSTLCGTPQYFAPEMVKGKPYTKAADIWSLGVLLFQILTGFLPFQGQTLSELLKKIVYSDIIFPSFLTSQVTDLIRKMLNKSPSERITIEMVQKHPWLNRDECFNNVCQCISQL